MVSSTLDVILLALSMPVLMKVFCWLAISFLLAPSIFAQGRTNVNGIAVIVDDAIITRQEVSDYIGSAAKLMLNTVRDPEMRDLRLSKLYENGTEDLVKRQLILHEYKTAGYNYPESIIDDRIEERIKRQWRDHAQLRLDLRERGQTYETFRKQEKEEILIIAMRQLKMPQDVLISPQKIRDYYVQHQTNYAVGEEVKLRLIVLNKLPSDSGAVKQLAEEILRKISEGTSFAEMARIHSDSPQRKEGGDSGWAERTTIRKELADVAFTLKPGERSGVIDLPDSCWLIQVEDRRAARTRPLAEVRDQIERELRIQEAERQEQKWVKRLRDKSFVRYYN
jgi:peptidyl-prolyl cis-trans isomerase SurA